LELSFKRWCWQNIFAKAQSGLLSEGLMAWRQAKGETPPSLAGAKSPVSRSGKEEDGSEEEDGKASLSHLPQGDL